MSAKGNIYILMPNTIKQVIIRAVVTRGADELLDLKNYKLFDSQDFTGNHLRYPIKSTVFTVPVIYFAKQQTEKVDTVEVKFTQETIERVHIEKKFITRSPLAGGLSKSCKKSGDDSKERKKNSASILHLFQRSTCLKCSSSRRLNHYKVTNHNKKCKGVLVQNSVTTQFATALHCNNYRQEKKPQEYKSYMFRKVAKKR